MNSYLMRLSDSARNPGGTIRPVLRSIFAGPEGPHAAVPFGWEDRAFSNAQIASPATVGPQSFSSERSVTAPMRRPQADAPVDETPSLPLLSTPPGPAGSKPRLERREGRTAAPPMPTVQAPLVSPVQAPTGSLEETKPIVGSGETTEHVAKFMRVSTRTWSPHVIPVSGPATDSDPEVGRREEPRAPQSPSYDSRAIVASAYQPSPPPPAHADGSPGIINETGESPVSVVPKPRGATVASQFGRKVEGPGDEIQIHIGRIEVTAVPQAPTPAPPRQARKSVSLDEYLKRRDPRAL
jgi:hypothetical protein